MPGNESKYAFMAEHDLDLNRIRNAMIPKLEKFCDVTIKQKPYIIQIQCREPSRNTYLSTIFVISVYEL